MNATLGTQLLVLAVGAGWTVIFHFVKRTLASIDRKLEENSRQTAAAAAELRQREAARDEKAERRMRALALAAARQMERALKARCGACERQYVSRQEFGAFTASINHKIDTIYDCLKKDERTPQ